MQLGRLAQGLLEVEVDQIAEGKEEKGRDEEGSEVFNDENCAPRNLGTCSLWRDINQLESVQVTEDCGFGCPRSFFPISRNWRCGYIPRSLTWMTLDSLNPVSLIVVFFALGTTLRSLPLVMRRRWTEAPEAVAIALYTSSPEEVRATVSVLGSLRMGLPGELLVGCCSEILRHVHKVGI